MQAIQISKPGGIEVLELVSVPVPSPGPKDALIGVEAAGVNFIDIYHRNGLYTNDFPFIPGVEGGGTVLEIGSAVHEVKVGDKVTYAMQLGSYAEQAVVPSKNLIPVPKGLTILSAVAATVQGLTAHYLSRSTSNLTSESSVLIHAAAGGVGRLLVQMARIIGCEVYATVSTENKAKIAHSAGAQHVINYSVDNFLEKVTKLTDGKGVDVVFDSVGKSTFQDSLKCLKPRGLLCLFGQSSGPVSPLDPQLLNSSGSVFLTRPSLNHYAANRQELLARAKEIYTWIEKGLLSVQIDRTFPLVQVAKAHQVLEQRKSIGKILLINQQFPSGD